MGRNGWIAVLVVGGSLMFAPVVGVLATVIGLKLAFDAVATADPATKSQVLAEGISEAMNATAFGLVLFVFGSIAAAVAIFQLLRKRSSPPAR